MSKRKETITIPNIKPRNYDLINLQVKGLLRTKVIKNKKKENKKFNYKKEMSYYSSICLASV